MQQQEKVIVQNGGRAQLKPKTSLEGAGSLMAEISKIYVVDIWTAETSNNTGYCQPRHSPVPETAT